MVTGKNTTSYFWHGQEIFIPTFEVYNHPYVSLSFLIEETPVLSQKLYARHDLVSDYI